MTVPTSTLGSCQLEVSRIGLGCVTFGREIDERESFRILDYAFERGITLLDTAESYGGGQAREYRKRQLGVDDVRETTGEMHSSERIIGRWLASSGVRKNLILQTKVTTNFSSAHVAAALDRSLERLQTDCVDIYLCHAYDPCTPLDVAVAAMSDVVRNSKARVIGCSNFTTDQIKYALDIARGSSLPRFEVVQPIYNLIHREIEEDLLPLCEEEAIAPITYSPLGAGFLTGKYKAGMPSPTGSRFNVIPDHENDYFSDRNFRLVEILRNISKATGMSMARLAMSWVFSNPSIKSVLIGATKREHIDNAISSLERLPGPLLDQLRRLSSLGS